MLAFFNAGLGGAYATPRTRPGFCSPSRWPKPASLRGCATASERYTGPARLLVAAAATTEPWEDNGKLLHTGFVEAAAATALGPPATLFAGPFGALAEAGSGNIADELGVLEKFFVRLFVRFAPCCACLEQIVRARSFLWKVLAHAPAVAKVPCAFRENGCPVAGGAKFLEISIRLCVFCDTRAGAATV